MSEPAGAVSPAAVRYLEAIFYIRAEEGAVRAGRLAEWLGVSAPSVSESIRRMERDGLLEPGSGRSIVLTPAGESAAAQIVRRHRIVEVWLTKSLSFDWVSADAEAHRIAHTLSEEVLERLHESLGRPRVCPHGNEIPGEPQEEVRMVRLASLRPGESGEVARVSEVTEHESPLVLTVLEQAGLWPGALVSVRAADGDGITAEVGSRKVELPANTAGAVWVKPVGLLG